MVRENNSKACGNTLLKCRAETLGESASFIDIGESSVAAQI